MKKLLCILPPFLVFFFVNSPLAAQIVGGEWATQFQSNGATAGAQFGFSISDVSDIDGDGISDWIVGAPYDDNGWGGILAGTARMYSGATGFSLGHFIGATGDFFGESVSAAGDLDGDGRGDVIIGATGTSPGGVAGAGSVYVYSAATGVQIFRFDGSAAGDHMGSAVAGTNDVDGDGIPDLIVGARDADPSGLINAGSVFVFSGANGALLWQFDGAASGDWFGYSVSGAGDVNSDGHEDLIIGAYGAAPAGFAWAGSAYVYSGATGSLLWQFDGTNANDLLGDSVSTAGDVDNDGFADVFVGIQNSDPGGRTNAGSAVVYSGATGTVLRQFDGEAAGDSFGRSVSTAGDVDGDGVVDLIVGAQLADPGGRAKAGSVYVYSGASGMLLAKFDGVNANDRLGQSVSSSGDTNGDGLSEVMAGANLASPGGMSSAGSAFTFTLDPYLHTSSLELSASSGVPVVFDIDFPTSEGGAAYTILASLSGIGPNFTAGILIPLTADSFFSQMLAGNISPLLQNARGLLDANGDAQALLSSSPTLASAVGLTVYIAAISVDYPSLTGRRSSIAKYMTIVP